jgi:hypothetical protein
VGERKADLLSEAAWQSVEEFDTADRRETADARLSTVMNGVGGNVFGKKLSFFKTGPKMYGSQPFHGWPWGDGLTAVSASFSDDLLR